MKFGIQLYSVYKEMYADAYGTLKTLKESGYDGVEFAGLFGHTPQEMKQMCGELDLDPVSAHVNIAEFDTDADAVFEVYRNLGCRYVGIPMMRHVQMPGNPGFPDGVRRLYELAETAGQHGLTMMYHNHDLDFCKYMNYETDTRRFALDMILEDAPAGKLMAELDIGWIDAANLNPVDFIRRYRGRVPVLHFKDYWHDPDARFSSCVYTMDGEPYLQFHLHGENFTAKALGRGLADIPACAAAARECGTEWIIVEQDNPADGIPPVESARISLDYLKNNCGF